MANPFKAIWTNEVTRAITVETIGNEIFALSRRLLGNSSETVPEVKEQGKDGDDKQKPQSKPKPFGFGRTDEAHAGDAETELRAQNPYAYAKLAPRLAELDWLGRAAYRVTIALYEIPEKRVAVLQNWSELDNDQWEEFKTRHGFNRWTRFIAYIKELDAQLAENLQQRADALKQQHHDPNQLLLPGAQPPQAQPVVAVRTVQQRQEIETQPVQKSWWQKIPKPGIFAWTAILIALMAIAVLGPLFFGI